MGQANSRGSSNPRARNRSRPASWLLPSSRPAEAGTAVDYQPSSAARPVSQISSPLDSLSRLISEQPDAGTSTSSTNLSRRRSRITRARSSLSASIPSLFNRRSQSHSVGEPEPFLTPPLTSPPPTRLPPRHTVSEGQGSYLPRVQVPELDLHFDDIPTALAPEHTSRLHSRRDARPSSMISSLRPDRGIRSMTSSLRRRRSPMQRDEDQAAMLSRLLSVAAAATAASLMGDDHRAVAEARNVAGDGEDGTFDSFLQALQNGRIASALRQSGSENGSGSGVSGASPAPLNFFRMFRFGSSNGSRDSNDGLLRSGSRRSRHVNEDEDEDGRMVPIIIVGIRSINPAAASPHDDSIPPFLDALSGLPIPLGTSPGDSPLDAVLRQPQNGTRFSHRRRASMGGMNTFPSNYDSQRHYRAPDRPRPWSTFTDSPSGPLPPPSTPASSGLSAVSSGATTPTFSASSSSPVIQSTAPSRRGSFVRRPTATGLETTAEEPTIHHRTPRQRRLSESDFTRFGSGSSRRNGVVEPDHNPGEGARSWIIYVLGGSYPENHPILTTPSLFTDSPTYEDMLLLSSLLGPAKPPVASEEDVAAAPGLYLIRESGPHLVAEASGGAEVIRLSADSRCLVCLSDFAADEMARKLVKCGHIFHKECIDQWLMTGRNSCPLCRGQGVDEKTPTDGSDPGSTDATGPGLIPPLA